MKPISRTVTVRGVTYWRSTREIAAAEKRQIDRLAALAATEALTVEEVRFGIAFRLKGKRIPPEDILIFDSE